MKRAVTGLALLTLSACSLIQGSRGGDIGSGQEISGESRSGATTDVLVRPKARPNGRGNRIADIASGLVPANAQRPSDFDTVSDSEKASATSGSVQGLRLGETIASLGNPAETGLWIKTPLVQSEQDGRVFFSGTGKSVAVTLIPLSGPPTAGSQISLSAMQTLGLGLDQLPTVEIFAAG